MKKKTGNFEGKEEINQSKKRSAVPSKILVEDEGHLSSVCVTFRSRGGSRAGRVLGLFLNYVKCDAGKNKIKNDVLFTTINQKESCPERRTHDERAIENENALVKRKGQERRKKS